MELAVELAIDLGAYPASAWDVDGESMGTGWRKYEDDRKKMIGRKIKNGRTAPTCLQASL